jgi:hypothetical protein
MRPSLWLTIASLVLASLVPATTAGAEYLLRTRVGQCEYTYVPQRDERYTKCTADAYLTNTASSEMFFCQVDVQGDQYLAPSVVETAPETVLCTRIGQPFAASGSYDIVLTDDAAKADRTQNRMRGSFSWNNAFWVFSRTAPDVKFCTRRLSGAAPDFRIRCSKRVDWQK